MLFPLGIVLAQEERTQVVAFDEALFQGSALGRMTRLHDLYREPVFKYVSRRLRPIDAAEDVTAQTFEAAFHSLSKLRRKDDAYVWLLGIARRKLANAYRQRTRRGEEALPEDLQGGEGGEELVLAVEQRDRIRRAVLDLPTEQREALLLQYLEGLSQKQISEIIGKSPSAVNSLLQRGRTTLLVKLRPYFPELEDLHV